MCKARNPKDIILRCTMSYFLAFILTFLLLFTTCTTRASTGEEEQWQDVPIDNQEAASAEYGSSDLGQYHQSGAEYTGSDIGVYSNGYSSDYGGQGNNPSYGDPSNSYSGVIRNGGYGEQIQSSGYEEQISSGGYGGEQVNSYGGEQVNSYSGERNSYGGGQVSSYGGGQVNSYGGGQINNYGGGQVNSYGGEQGHGNGYGGEQLLSNGYAGEQLQGGSYGANVQSTGYSSNGYGGLSGASYAGTGGYGSEDAYGGGVSNEGWETPVKTVVKHVVKNIAVPHPVPAPVQVPVPKYIKYFKPFAIAKPVAVPHVIPVVKHIQKPIPFFAAVPVKHTVPVPKFVGLPVHVRVPRPVFIHVPKIVPVAKKYAVPVTVNVPKPYIVPVYKHVPVPVPHKVPKIINVVKEVPHYVKKPVPVYVDEYPMGYGNSGNTITSSSYSNHYGGLEGYNAAGYVNDDAYGGSHGSSSSTYSNSGNDYNKVNVAEYGQHSITDTQSTIAFNPFAFGRQRVHGLKDFQSLQQQKLQYPPQSYPRAHRLPTNPEGQNGGNIKYQQQQRFLSHNYRNSSPAESSYELTVELNQRGITGTNDNYNSPNKQNGAYNQGQVNALNELLYQNGKNTMSTETSLTNTALQLPIETINSQFSQPIYNPNAYAEYAMNQQNDYNHNYSQPYHGKNAVHNTEVPAQGMLAQDSKPQYYNQHPSNAYSMGHNSNHQNSRLNNIPPTTDFKSLGNTKTKNLAGNNNFPAAFNGNSNYGRLNQGNGFKPQSLFSSVHGYPSTRPAESLSENANNKGTQQMQQFNQQPPYQQTPSQSNLGFNQGLNNYNRNPTGYTKSINNAPQKYQSSPYSNNENNANKFDNYLPSGTSSSSSSFSASISPHNQNFQTSVAGNNIVKHNEKFDQSSSQNSYISESNIAVPSRYNSGSSISESPVSYSSNTYGDNISNMQNYASPKGNTFLENIRNQLNAQNLFRDQMQLNGQNQGSELNKFGMPNQFNGQNKFNIPNQLSEQNQYNAQIQFGNLNEFNRPSQLTDPSQLNMPNQYTMDQSQLNIADQTIDQKQFNIPSQFNTQNQFNDQNQYNNPNQLNNPNQYNNPNQFSDQNQYNNPNQFSDQNQYNNPNQFNNQNQYNNLNQFTDPNQFNIPSQLDIQNKFNPANQFDTASIFDDSNLPNSENQLNDHSFLNQPESVPNTNNFANQMSASQSTYSKSSDTYNLPSRSSSIYPRNSQSDSSSVSQRKNYHLQPTKTNQLQFKRNQTENQQLRAFSTNNPVTTKPPTYSTSYTYSLAQENGKSEEGNVNANPSASGKLAVGSGRGLKMKNYMQNPPKIEESSDSTLQMQNSPSAKTSDQNSKEKLDEMERHIHSSASSIINVYTNSPESMGGKKGHTFSFMDPTALGSSQTSTFFRPQDPEDNSKFQYSSDDTKAVQSSSYPRDPSEPLQTSLDAYVPNQPVYNSSPSDQNIVYKEAMSEMEDYKEAVSLNSESVLAKKS